MTGNGALIQVWKTRMTPCLNKINFRYLTGKRWLNVDCSFVIISVDCQINRL